MKGNTRLYIITFVITFLISLAFFKVIRGAGLSSSYNAPSNGSGAMVDNEPKTEECPLNGALFSKTQRQKWESRRPLGIMIENSVDARPQSGLTNADVIFEGVAEGGITRFLTIYYCQDNLTIGPVRSARVYFIDFLGGFGNSPLYAHVGGANTPGPADALGQIDDMGWGGYNDLNQFSVGFPVYWRDYERLPGVATEHTMYSSTQKLWDTAAKRELTSKDEDGVAWDKDFVAWTFKEDAPADDRPTAFNVSFGFWEDYKDFDVRWTYSPTTNTYLRSNGGKKHLDKNTGKQLSAKNVVVVFMDESVAQDGYDKGQHLLYETEGTGDALIFQDGVATKGSWSKEDRFSQIIFYDAKDNEVKFNPGLIWVEMLPTGNKVTYK